MGTELVTFEAMQSMSKAVAASRLWKTVDTPEKALALMLLCQSEGLHPMTAVRRYDLIQGTPALKSEAQLAEFYKRGGAVVWMQRTAEVCEAKFSHPKHCPDGVIIKWTIEDARKAGLANKENWKNYPRQMLSARVQAEGVQVVDPGAGLGMLTPEEAIDVQSNLADMAAASAQQLTGEKYESMEALPEVTLDGAELKKARAELNRQLLACETTEQFRAAAKAFQEKYTKGIWVKLTGHKPEETFSVLAQTHQERVQANDFRKSPAGLAKWREEVMAASESVFRNYQEQYIQNEFLQTQENSDALSMRGRELGLDEYAADENEIHKLSD